MHPPNDDRFHAELRAAIRTDVVLELRRLCFEVAREFRHSVFFAGQLVFGGDLNGFMSRFLHNHTTLDLLQSPSDARPQSGHPAGSRHTCEDAGDRARRGPGSGSRLADINSGIRRSPVP